MSFVKLYRIGIRCQVITGVKPVSDDFVVIAIVRFQVIGSMYRGDNSSDRVRYMYLG